MASTGECDGAAVGPAMAGTLKLGAVRPLVWPKQLVGVVEKGWRYPPRPYELGWGGRSLPLPHRAGQFWNLPARGGLAVLGHLGLALASIVWQSSAPALPAARHVGGACGL